MPTPKPGPLEVLCRVRVAGICGSDLSVVRRAREVGAGFPFDGVVLGHEFLGEVVECGPGAEAWKPGTRVVSSPHIPVFGAYPGADARRGPEGLPAPNNYYLNGNCTWIGFNQQYPGGFGEYVVLSAPLMQAVPAGAPDSAVATTEPAAVALHTVRLARLRPGDTALVIGAGPIGLMTLLWLKREGVRHVAVTEHAAARRELAAAVGADLVLDPRTDDVAARLAAAAGPPTVIIDSAGKAGTLQSAMELAAPEGRIVVVGACGTPDPIVPTLGLGKQLSIQFVMAYDCHEFAESLAAIADGSLKPAPLVTRQVSLDELPDAFLSLDAPTECKVQLVF